MCNSKKLVTVGIMPLAKFKQRTFAIARGEYKPTKDEPKIWFPSIKSLANVLSEENQQLLKMISTVAPQSIAELEPITGRKANNLLRTLRRMEAYGLVDLTPNADHTGAGKAPLKPTVRYNMANIQLNWQ